MNKKDLLKEELKRHMQLLEYTFYMPEASDDKDSDVNGDLILGGKKLYEQDPVPGEEEATEDPFATPVEGGEDQAVEPSRYRSGYSCRFGRTNGRQMKEILSLMEKK